MTLGGFRPEAKAPSEIYAEPLIERMRPSRMAAGRAYPQVIERETPLR